MEYTNKETMEYMRSLYMEGKISHAKYYLWLADLVGANYSDIPFDDEKLLNSKDEHLNDLPLRKWDNMDVLIRRKAYSRGLPWSLSDTVCVLKSLARKKIVELQTMSLKN